MTRRLAVVWIAALLGVAHAAPARGDGALAERLFAEGRRLMAAGDCRGALAKLGESYRLDPAHGTLMNLAVCHEQIGMIATAWAEFVKARDSARRSARPDREALAVERIAALEPRLPKVTIVVARASSTAVSLDGTVLGAAAWGVALPVDPGGHEVKVTAPGRIAWTTRFEIAESAAHRIEVPELALAPMVVAKRPSRAPMIAAIGVGVAGVAVGSYFGVRAIGYKREADQHCPGDLCDGTGLRAQDSYQRAAWGANLGFGVGVTAAVVATVLYLRTGSAPVRPRGGGAELAFEW